MLNLVKKTRSIPKIEVDKAIKSLQELFIEEKSKGWRDGIPVICIIGMEAITVSKELNAENEYEGTMRKFLNFCVYCSDNRLCHIVLVTTHTFSHDVLDQCRIQFLV
jgi:hypothetical protein